MSKIDYQSLREAVQNYQSTLAWYQEKPDSPNAERDCDAALAAFKREIHHREVDIIAGLLDELDEKQQYIKLRDQENEDIALTVGKLRVELEAAEKRIAELESNEVREVGNQFLVVRHPGKTPVIKHCTGDLEEFLRKLIEQDPLVTIDIITHRYYGIGGQWVQDAVEYLHMMSDAGIRIKGGE